jgi:hypothetical protein
MSEYLPDNWVVLKINHEGKTLYKVLAGWIGGYLNGDSWRMNSGMNCVKHNKKHTQSTKPKNDKWWNGLTEEEREDAFYAVCKRIHEADLVNRGTYRHTLYDVFGFDMNMYGKGIDCGFMAIHNAIFDGEELQAMKKVTRVEVIDEEGRTYVNHLNEDQRVKYSLQDDDRTLKVFIDNLS